MNPKNLKYSKNHEWLKVEGDKAKLGITFFAQEQMGDVVFVELPNEGDSFEAKQSMGVVESVKAVSDIYTPISGNIAAVNEALLDSPELINEDPYGQGWLVEITYTNSGELDGLLSAEEYEQFVREEE